jgi:hypothetical protein
MPRRYTATMLEVRKVTVATSRWMRSAGVAMVNVALMALETADDARLSPMRATTVPVTTGGMSLSIQAGPQRSVMTAATP